MTDPVERDLPAEDELVPEDDTIIGVAFRWSLVGLTIIIAGVVLGFYLKRETEPVEVVIERGPIKAPDRLAQGAPDMPAIRFTDITSGAGIDFVHISGAQGEKLLPETMGGGCAFFDYDGDGNPDLLLVNSTVWAQRTPDDAPASTMALYRNDGTGHFENVTSDSGLDVSFYGMGAAVGDYDNDGHVDVFISALGANHLFRNVGGSFEDVTEDAGVAGGAETWSTSAGFFDCDNDGDLDLFVCNYVQWSRTLDLQLSFTLNGTDRAYGPPKQYQGTHSYLYRNNGDGTFTDVSAERGIHIDNPATGQAMGKALAVTFVDVDGDGWLEIFVANDTIQNFVFHNNGDGSFTERGAEAGVAFDSMGSATGAMGMDAGDFANDGTLGVGIGNFASESTSFYVQQAAPWQFAEMSSAEGIGSPSRLKLSFGLFLFDCDLDGRLDLLQANGHLEDEINEIQPSQHYRQPAQLFWNCGPEARTCFAAVPEDQVGDLSKPIVGRGASYADIDGDGDLDVLLTQTGGRPLLLRNDTALGHPWLRIKLVGSSCNRDAIGAWVELTAGGVTQRRQVMPTRSYLSQVELPVTFGLGSATHIDTLRVMWPNGTTDEVVQRELNSMLIIEQPRE